MSWYKLHDVGIALPDEKQIFHRRETNANSDQRTNY